MEASPLCGNLSPRWIRTWKQSTLISLGQELPEDVDEAEIDQDGAVSLVRRFFQFNLLRRMDGPVKDGKNAISRHTPSANFSWSKHVHPRFRPSLNYPSILLLPENESSFVLQLRLDVELLVISVDAIRVILSPSAFQVCRDPRPFSNSSVKGKDLGMLPPLLQLRHGLGKHELDTIHTLR